MNRLQLSSGDFVLLDDEDYDVFSVYYWHLSSSGYASRNVYRNKQSVKILLHREIMGVSNSGNLIYVDHINRDKLDNRKSNLRVCTPTQNHANCIKNSTNKSGYKGVVYYPEHKINPYSVYIQYKRKTIYVGRYNNLKDRLLS